MFINVKALILQHSVNILQDCEPCFKLNSHVDKLIICQMQILKTDWSIPGHMTFNNGAY